MVRVWPEASTGNGGFRVCTGYNPDWGCIASVYSLQGSTSVRGNKNGLSGIYS